MRDREPTPDQIAFHAQFALSLRRVLIMLAMADGKTAPAEFQTVLALYKSLIGTDMSVDEFNAVLDEQERAPQTVTQYLSTVAPSLNDDAKAFVLEAAILLAGADGSFQEREQQLLGEIAGALDLTAAQVERVVAELQKRQDSR